MENPEGRLLFNPSHCTRDKFRLETLLMPASSSIDTDEIARFSGASQDWWNPEGLWRPLHKLNPARIDYIRKTVCDHFKRPCEGAFPFKGLSVLDIGCGGGLLCEPLARLGAKVMGLDASAKAIEVARKHAAREKLKITYIDGSVEDFARSKEKFDVVLAMEILEHVSNVGSLLRSASALLKPDGILIVSTLNRTMKSYLLGIIAAEYVLGWVPEGMHDWNKFIRPSELEAHLRQAGMKLTDLTGMVYNPLSDSFSLRRGKVGVNYLATAKPISR
jgi:2-polyprenyl-6-hydroxyphenyl methylase/3-demethylubiquinone-9 3-methyltransferase